MSLDLLTIDEAKRAINMDTANDDNSDVIARHIAAVSALVDARCGPVVQRTVTAELVQTNNSRRLWLARRPVTSITEVREAWPGRLANTVPAVGFGVVGDGYRALAYSPDPALLSGVLERIGCAWAPEVEVSYLAGRFVDTESVPLRFKDTAGAILRRLWKREAGAWAASPDYWNTESGTANAGFYKVGDAVIDELLADEVQREVLIA